MSAPDPVAPLVAWLERHRAARAVTRPGPLVVGVHGPQGAGKSTLCARLVAALAAAGRHAVSVSIDDFYLTHAEQRALAARHPGNRALEHRGYPGTHDVALGVATLDALAATTPGAVAIPEYDKSAHGGRGDRQPPERWPRVATPLDVVFVEGWMLLFAPVPDAAVADPDLVAPNRYLAAYAAWRERLDVALVLALADGDLDRIVAWRVDAERQRRARGAPGLTDTEAHDYVARFLPAYRLWTPRAPAGAPTLTLTLGADRQPTSLDDTLRRGA